MCSISVARSGGEGEGRDNQGKHAMAIKYFKPPYVTVGKYKSGGVIGAGSSQDYIDDPIFWRCAVYALSFCDAPRTRDEIRAYLLGKFGDLNLANEVLKYILDKWLRVFKNFHDTYDRYSRNKLFYDSVGADPVQTQ